MLRQLIEVTASALRTSQQRLAANDLLNEYLLHTASGIFAIPASVRPGEQTGKRVSGPLLRPVHRWRELMGDPSHDPVGDLTNSAQELDHGCLVEHHVGRIVEDYDELKRALCLHARVRTIHGNATNEAQWRVLFQRSPKVQFDAVVANDAAGVRELQVTSCGDDGGRVYYPVLVSVGEFAENGKLVVRRLILTLVRLVLVQPPEMFVGKKWANHRIVESLASVLNRELDLAGLLVIGLPLEVNERELPNGVVKSGAQVVDAVTDTNAPLQDGKSTAESRRIEGYLRSLRVVLAPDAVRVRAEEPGHVFVQGLYVFERASGLGLGTVK